MDAEKKRVIDEAIEKLTNLTANRAGTVTVGVDTLDLIDKALSYAIEAAVTEARAAEIDPFLALEEYRKHRHRVEAFLDKSKGIATLGEGCAIAAGAYLKALDERIKDGSLVYNGKGAALIQAYNNLQKAMNVFESVPDLPAAFEAQRKRAQNG